MESVCIFYITFKLIHYLLYMHSSYIYTVFLHIQYHNNIYCDPRCTPNDANLPAEIPVED
jgi:hypothetical protein